MRTKILGLPDVAASAATYFKACPSLVQHLCHIDLRAVFFIGDNAALFEPPEVKLAALSARITASYLSLENLHVNPGYPFRRRR